MSTLRNHDGRIENENGAMKEAAGGVETCVEESHRKGRRVSRRHAGMTTTTGRRRHDTLVLFRRLVVDTFNTTTTSFTSERERERENTNDLAVSSTGERISVSVEGEAA